ncbi:MAG: FAD-dependent oxidoreductase [Myxococcales bacterium]|nr:FAD-dependent oxidoreductase [Myxococcales bacterium]
MSRTPLFGRLARTLRSAEPQEPIRMSRRDALRVGLVAAGAVAIGGCSAGGAAADGDVGARSLGAGAGKKITASVGIVGAGIAGIACAYDLKKRGVVATVHEANARAGGRIWSMGGSIPGPVMFPGQVVERGGELIDTPHKTMIGYARELGLPLEDITKPARETVYLFRGQRIPEATMVDEYRALVDAMRDDLRVVGSPTAAAFTPAEQALDRTSLRQWLEERGAGTNIAALLNVAYEIEYGIPTDRMSCLAFLLFAKASRQSKLRLWGNFSDERYHVIGGNEQIVRGLVAKLPGQIRYGRTLVAARKTPAGRIELTFREGSTSVTAVHDAVVLSLPFTMLKHVDLDPTLGIPDWKRYAIDHSVYGTNAKLMIGFEGRPWVDQGGSGAAYSDRAHLQTSWETNPSNATATRGVITDYAGGALGAGMTDAQAEAEAFLDAFDLAYPGAKAKARRDAAGRVVAHLEPWPSDPFVRGSYSANGLGYFTTIADNEAKAVGNLYFAGETTSSFYEWQGFMEGGALSGLRAAGEIVRDFG